MTAPALIRLAALRLRLDIEKAKNFDPNQPRHPKGHPDGGKWSDGFGSFFQNLFGSAATAPYTLGSLTWGTHIQGPPPHTFKRPGSVKHTAVDDHGRDVYIHRPKQATPPSGWGGPDTIVTITPGAPGPAMLNGIALGKPVEPKDWTKVAGQNPGIEAGLEDLEGHKYKHNAAGVIIEEPDGRVWLTSPTNGYGGYRNTFPKGTQEHGLTLQQTAIKEAFEETGLNIEITGVLGDFERTTSVSRFYMARRVGGSPTYQGWESQAMRLVPRRHLRKFLNMPVDRDISSLLFDEHQLGKQRTAFLDPDALQALSKRMDTLTKAMTPKGPGSGGGNRDGWKKQKRWPKGSPLGGQWMAYDSNGLIIPPMIGTSKVAQNWIQKQEAFYAALIAGDLAEAKKIADTMIAGAEAKGWVAGGGNDGSKFKAAQYMKEQLAQYDTLSAVEIKADSIGGPSDLTDYKKIGPKPGGSNPGGVYQDKLGAKWLVKGANYPSDDRAKNEVLASKLMMAAGVAAPEMKLVNLGSEYGGGLGVMARMEDLDHWSKSNPVHLANAQADFAVHAWLANYDAVGQPVGDNLSVLKDTNEVFNPDPGGALLYRAQGLPKALPGGMLADDVKELFSMRDAMFNQYSHAVYGGMTKTQLIESMGKVAAVSEDTIAGLVKTYGPGDAAAKAKLLHALEARRAYLMTKALELEGPKVSASVVTVAATAAASIAIKGDGDGDGKPWEKENAALGFDAGTTAILNAADSMAAAGEMMPAKGWMGIATSQAHFDLTAPGSLSLLDSSEKVMVMAAANKIASLGPLGTDEQTAVLQTLGAKIDAIQVNPANGLGQAKVKLLNLIHAAGNDLEIDDTALAGVWHPASDTSAVAAPVPSGGWGPGNPPPGSAFKKIDGTFFEDGPDAPHNSHISHAKEALTLYEKGDLEGLKHKTDVWTVAATTGDWSGTKLSETGQHNMGVKARYAQALVKDLEAKQAAPGPTKLLMAPVTLHNTTEGHNKFWTVEVKPSGDSYAPYAVVRTWGKIGTAGQTMTSTYSSNEMALKEAEKLIAAKKSGGYVEQKPANGGFAVGDADHDGKAYEDRYGDGPPPQSAWKSPKGSFAHVAAGMTAAGTAGGDSLPQAVSLWQSVVDAGKISPEAEHDYKLLISYANHLQGPKGLKGDADKDGIAYEDDKDEVGTLAGTAAAWQASVDGMKAEADKMVVAAGAPEAASASPMAAANHQIAQAIYDGNSTAYDAGTSKLQAWVDATYTSPEGKLMAGAYLKHWQGVAWQKGMGSGDNPDPGAGLDPTPTMPKVDGGKIMAMPSVNFAGVPGSKGMAVKLNAAGLKAYGAMVDGDLTKLQAAYDEMNGLKGQFKFGSKGRVKIAGMQHWASKTALENIPGLTLKGGKFTYAGAAPASDAATAQAQALLATIPGGITDEGKFKVWQAYQHLESGNDMGVATAIGYLGADPGAGPSGPLAAEKLIAVAEAKGGFPMATGDAVTITHAGQLPHPSYKSVDWTNYTLKFDGSSADMQASMLQSQQQYLDSDLNPDKTGDTQKFVAYASQKLGKPFNMKAGVSVNDDGIEYLQVIDAAVPTPKLALPPVPKAPSFQPTTPNAVDYYNGKIAAMETAYLAGDLTALQEASYKPGKQGQPFWPTYQTGTKAGQPKGINALQASQHFNMLEAQLLAAQKTTTENMLDAPVGVIPSEGTNKGDLPAMPVFSRHLLVASSNVNAPSNNKKIEQIAALATKGDVKGLIALGYGINTYGKKQAKLANDALAALGSPFKVDPGQKKNSHPALFGGGTTTAGAAKTAALTDKEMPAPLDFNNWNGAGKGLSSKAALNEANQADQAKLFAYAKAGDFNGLKAATFDKLTSDGSPTGAKASFTEHPSQHLQNLYHTLIQQMDEKLNPPKPLEIFEAKQAAKSMAALSAQVLPKPLGTGTHQVPSSQVVGYFLALGQVKNYQALVPKKEMPFSHDAKAKAHSDYSHFDGDAKSFVSQLQSTGGHPWHGAFDASSKTHLTDMTKAAHKYSRAHPAGTTVYKWLNPSADMKKKLLSAQPGLIVQNVAPVCTSYNPSSTSHFGNHRFKIVFSEGARSISSFGSGSHSSEGEVTMLPNSRYMLLSATQGETVFLLLPPDPTYPTDYWDTH